MPELISLNNLKKSFASVPVLKGISFSLCRGDIFGLLGLNGAGKTTLIKCVLGLLGHDQGRIRFKGRALQAEDIYRQCGFLPENFFPPRNLKGREFLKIMAVGLCFSRNRVEELLALTGMSGAGDKYIRNYSRGMIQRLGICTALLKNPEVLILDEPALGLDPAGQKDIIDLLSLLNSQGKTVFFSSHILSQIEKVCSRAAILDQGLISWQGQIKDLKEKHGARDLEQAFLKQVGQR